MRRPVTMRICGPDDERALYRLAKLDSARPLEGTVLVGEVEGEPLAAICLETRRVVADPFAHTAALVDLLHTRAGQIEAGSAARVTRESRSLRRALTLFRRPTPEPNT